MSAKFIRPCIPTNAKAIPSGDAWLHEPKLDGYRFQIVKDGRQVKLYSRNGHEWTKSFAPRVHAERVGLALIPAGPRFTLRVSLRLRPAASLITRKTYLPGLTLEREGLACCLSCAYLLPPGPGSREGVQPAPVCPPPNSEHCKTSLEQSRWISQSTHATLAYQPGSNA